MICSSINLYNVHVHVPLKFVHNTSQEVHGSGSGSTCTGIYFHAETITGILTTPLMSCLKYLLASCCGIPTSGSEIFSKSKYFSSLGIINKYFKIYLDKILS